VIKSIVLVVFFISSSIPAYSSTPEYFNQVVDAIYKAEGGAKTRHPYGIVSIPTYGDKKLAKKYCYNTVKNQWARHERHFCGKDYLTCLRDRYAPLAASNDPKGLNRNWLKNVKTFMGEK
jgi:hypothetical protein